MNTIITIAAIAGIFLMAALVIVGSLKRPLSEANDATPEQETEEARAKRYGPIK